MKIFLILLLISVNCAFALEVDEKLTVRIVKTSETRKTVMINRGTEDGLVEGDHAKFIVTAGIVARGVTIKVSPTRSIWSIYRLVNADFIVNDSVMSIKITPPVKVTRDETQALVQEDTPTSVSRGDVAELGIPLADGAQDIPAAGEDSVSRSDLSALENDMPSMIPEKNWEVFGILNISGLSASTKTESGEDVFKDSQSSQHIGLGGEFYAQREREWYSAFSLQAMANFMTQNNQAYNGSSSTNEITELALGVNWHPTTLPSRTMVIIPYIHAGMNFGTVKSTYTPGKELPGGKEYSGNGGTQGFSGGVGFKFYTARGFGARVLVDYYLRSEIYGEDSELDTFTKTVSGPRLMIGLGYRF